jgi:hypothetical protein
VWREANWLEASLQPELAAASPKDASARRGAMGRGCAARSAAGGVCASRRSHGCLIGALRLGHGMDRGGAARTGQYGGGQAQGYGGVAFQARAGGRRGFLGPLGVRATSGWSRCVGKARGGAWTEVRRGRARGGTGGAAPPRARRMTSRTARRRPAGNCKVPLFERVKLQKVE